MAMNLLVIVDSSEVFGNFAANLLRPFFQDVLILKTGKELVEHTRLSEVALFLLEALLPDSTGFEVAARLRQVLPSVPITIMSFDREYEELCRSKGFDFVEKARLSAPTALSSLHSSFKPQDQSVNSTTPS